MTNQSEGQPEGVKRPANVPLYSMIATVIFLAAAVTLAIFADEASQTTTIVLGLIVSTLPSLVAAASAERTARDVRNGTLVEKVREGTTQAITEQGVIVRDGPVVRTELAALAQLLRQNTAATQQNTAHLIEADPE